MNTTSSYNREVQIEAEQAGAELGQAQLKMELGFTLSKIYCIKLMTRLTIDFAKL